MLAALASPDASGCAAGHTDDDGAAARYSNSYEQEARRRQAIVWQYEELGSPPPEKWERPGRHSCAHSHLAGASQFECFYFYLHAIKKTLPR